MWIKNKSFRKLVEIYLPEDCQIVDNCTFGSFYSEHLQQRGREFYTYLHLPLVRDGFLYQFVKHSQDTSNMFLPDNQNIYVWILQQTVLRPDTSYDKSHVKGKFVRLKYLNSLDNIDIPGRLDKTQ